MIEAVPGLQLMTVKSTFHLPAACCPNVFLFSQQRCLRGRAMIAWRRRTAGRRCGVKAEENLNSSTVEVRQV